MSLSANQTTTAILQAPANTSVVNVLQVASNVQILDYFRANPARIQVDQSTTKDIMPHNAQLSAPWDLTLSMSIMHATYAILVVSTAL